MKPLGERVSKANCEAKLKFTVSGEGRGELYDVTINLSHVTSISKNKMNLQIFICLVQHLDGILKISLETLSKKHILIISNN